MTDECPGAKKVKKEFDKKLKKTKISTLTTENAPTSGLQKHCESF